MSWIAVVVMALVTATLTGAVIYLLVRIRHQQRELEAIRDEARAAAIVEWARLPQQPSPPLDETNVRIKRKPGRHLGVVVGGGLVALWTSALAQFRDHRLVAIAAGGLVALGGALVLAPPNRMDEDVGREPPRSVQLLPPELIPTAPPTAGAATLPPTPASTIEISPRKSPMPDAVGDVSVEVESVQGEAGPQPDGPRPTPTPAATPTPTLTVTPTDPPAPSPTPTRTPSPTPTRPPPPPTETPPPPTVTPTVTPTTPPPSPTPTPTETPRECLIYADVPRLLELCLLDLG